MFHLTPHQYFFSKIWLTRHTFFIDSRRMVSKSWSPNCFPVFFFSFPQRRMTYLIGRNRLAKCFRGNWIAVGINDIPEKWADKELMRISQGMANYMQIAIGMHEFIWMHACIHRKTFATSYWRCSNAGWIEPIRKMKYCSMWNVCVVLYSHGKIR